MAAVNCRPTMAAVRCRPTEGGGGLQSYAGVLRLFRAEKGRRELPAHRRTSDKEEAWAACRPCEVVVTIVLEVREKMAGACVAGVS